MGSRFAGHVKAVEITDSAVMALMILALAAHRYLERQPEWLGSEGPQRELRLLALNSSGVANKVTDLEYLLHSLRPHGVSCIVPAGYKSPDGIGPGEVARGVAAYQYTVW